MATNRQIHGTTRRVPWERLMEERPRLVKLPGRAALAPYLREGRKVAQDGFVRCRLYRSAGRIPEFLHGRSPRPAMRLRG